MDQELKVCLDALRQGLMGQITESREHTERLNAETREHTERLNAETREHAERLNTETRKELTDRMLAINAETCERAERINAETREHAEHLHTQARVLIEDLGTKVGLIWEGVQAIKETLDSKLDNHEQRIQSLERKAL